MHAIVIHANIHDQAEAKRGLDEEVIPMMKGAPGFVGAYFVAVDDSWGFHRSVRVRGAGKGRRPARRCHGARCDA